MSGNVSGAGEVSAILARLCWRVSGKVSSILGVFPELLFSLLENVGLCHVHAECLALLHSGCVSPVLFRAERFRVAQVCGVLPLCVVLVARLVESGHPRVSCAHLNGNLSWHALGVITLGQACDQNNTEGQHDAYLSNAKPLSSEQKRRDTTRRQQTRQAA